MADDPDETYATDPLAAAELPAGGTVVTGENVNADEPMTEIQAAELRQVCDETGETFDGNLTQAQADDRIASLKGRG